MYWNTIDVKFILMCKRNKEGEVVKYGARLAVFRNEDHDVCDKNFSQWRNKL